MFLIGYISSSVIFHALKSLNNNVVTFIAYATLFISCGIYDIMRIKCFINKTFECLVCEEDFKPKWYRLLFTQWRQPKKYRVYKELDAGTFEKLIYKCPNCKNRECITKE